MYRMLFEFHRKQNAKKPHSVYATYLLDGTPRSITNDDQANGHSNGDDVPMQSSPFVSSAVQDNQKAEEYATPSRSIILTREEDLEEAKSKLETIHSIHIYSLQPSSLQNLQALADCNRSITANFNTEDPLVVGQRYGVIHNNSVRRRTAQRPPPGVAPSIAAVQKLGKTRQPRFSKKQLQAPKQAIHQRRIQTSSPKDLHPADQQAKPPPNRPPSRKNTPTSSNHSRNQKHPSRKKPPMPPPSTHPPPSRKKAPNKQPTSP